MAIGDLGATDIFGLGGSFHAQSSTTTNSNDVVEVLEGGGDVACLNQFNDEVTATVEYQVCGSTTLSVSLGDDASGFIIRSVELSHEAGQAPTVTIEGVAYDGGETVKDSTYAISQAVNIAAVASILTTPISGVEATSITHRWEMEVTTSMGSDGQVSYAWPRTPMVTYEESGSGTLASAPTVTGYTLESWENSDANQELDTYACTFKSGLTSVVA